VAIRNPLEHARKTGSVWYIAQCLLRLLRVAPMAQRFELVQLLIIAHYSFQAGLPMCVQHLIMLPHNVSVIQNHEVLQRTVSHTDL
jgi:hypothetical protein